MLSASRRWSPRRPEGPAALPRRKLRATARTWSVLRSGTWFWGGGPNGTKPGRAGGLWGCLARSLPKVVASLPRRGGLRRAAQARDNSPSAAKALQRACLATLAASGLVGGTGGRAAEASHNSSRSPSIQRRQRRRVCWAVASRRLAPPRRGGCNTALGNMSKSRQAGRELSEATWASALARHRAQALRAALGTWRRTGWWAWSTWSRFGSAMFGAGCCTRPTPADSRASRRQRGWTPLTLRETSIPQTLQVAKECWARYAGGTSPARVPSQWLFKWACMLLWLPHPLPEGWEEGQPKTGQNTRVWLAARPRPGDAERARAGSGGPGREASP